MQGAMCAGFMISTFKYEFEDAPEPKQEKNPSPNPHKGSKHRVAQDALVGTAFNLAKKSVGNPVTELHSDKVNHKQVHTEQLLCGQIDAFLTMVIDPISRPKVINVLDRFGYKSQAFDPKKMTVNVKIVFEHSKGNVKEDCKACSATIKRITDKWEPKLKGFDIAVSKNS
jgi:hypothetical protein